MAAVAATFLGGIIEALGSVIGPWLKKYLPRAALLGTVGGIALVWMFNKGFYDVYADPILGMPVLLIAIIGLIGGYVFPKKIPALLVAVVGGIIYAGILGRITPDFSGFGFYPDQPRYGDSGHRQGYGPDRSLSGCHHPHPDLQLQLKPWTMSNPPMRRVITTV